MSPEGAYHLANQIFFRSLTPYYNVGTSVSMVSIKYKESTNSNIDRYATVLPTSDSTLYPKSNTTSSQHLGDSIPPSHQLQKSNTIPLSPGYADSSSYLSPTQQATSSLPHITRSQTESSAITQGKQQSISTSLSSSMTSYSGMGGGTASSPRKPKTNITKTNSSFVQRIITNDQLAKILVARTSDDTNLFYNCGSNFVWMDASCRPMVSSIRLLYVV